MSVKNLKVQHIMVELKARANSLELSRNRLIEFGAKKIGVFHQIDTYYEVPTGRLKLREVEGKADSELIYYEREDVFEPKKNSVFIFQLSQSQILKGILNRILTIKGVVDKIREIYLYDDIQIHLDTVRDLGSYIEFERITSSDPRQQKKDLLKLERLRKRLNISSQSLERSSYSDLI
ncbi:MAG: class IV adenylate cyclase [Candidatus Bathyarchaeota archaeon]|nr:MAG: class IV adenylate cyclase [Candidatus Bathyarchaeota archaeon]